MPVINRLADFHAEITEWRRDIHAHPELQYDVHRTAGIVEEKLKSFGVDQVVTGIGRTGVVGIIKGKTDNSGKVIGLRADMDALPITERSGKPHASQTDGKMHACGHDGHTAMLLGAAKYLAETRNFDGTVAVIFQPAEEGGAGGRAMLKDGLMEKFGIDEVYGMHNWPGMPVGEFAIRGGGMMAATDDFTIEIEGVGGHAALPHNTIDPIIIGAHIITALQTLVSRNIDPIKSAVLSVTMMHGGDAFNIIPSTAKLTGTVRTLDEEVRNTMEKRLKDLVTGLAKSFGAETKIGFRHGYPVTVNDVEKANFAADVAALVSGEDRVDRNVDPCMGGEDFSFMLQAKPGAYIMVGQGDTAGLHQDSYDFNDEIIPIGCSYWVKLVETAMPAS